MKIINFSDLIEENGKTIKENNLDKKHNIPIGTLVTVEYKKDSINNTTEKIQANLLVFSHDRDCDGTPLYSLAKYKKEDISKSYFVTGMNLNPKFVEMFLIGKESGFLEEGLKVI